MDLKLYSLPGEESNRGNPKAQEAGFPSTKFYDYLHMMTLY